MKFCIDCRWCYLRGGTYLPRDQVRESALYFCRSPRNYDGEPKIVFDPVTGVEQDERGEKQPWCLFQRAEGGACGPEASWFEPKET